MPLTVFIGIIGGILMISVFLKVLLVGHLISPLLMLSIIGGIGDVMELMEERIVPVELININNI